MKSFYALLMVAAISVAGCSSDQATQKKLVDGKLALEQNNFDSALTTADSVVNSDASRGDMAAGYYLHGRAIEQRVKADPAVAQNDLSLARTDYNRALQLAPPKKLEGYIRASLGNVDYFQDDYAGAFEQWSTAFNLLSEADLKAWTLYRIGLTQQRMGRFPQADQTFVQVQSQFPGTEQASRARERHGVRGFQVQLATFTNAKNADASITELKKQGVTPTKTTDPRGLSVIRVGPYATYAEAQQIKHRFAVKYADAIILP
ncbi:hypothetical protein BH10PLA1_BH10PLA1_13280 [soil metagenome]